MLNDVYQEMTTLTKVDSFCRDFYLRNGHYMVNPTIEEIKALLEMWGMLEDVISQSRQESDISEKGRYRPDSSADITHHPTD